MTHDTPVSVFGHGAFGRLLVNQLRAHGLPVLVHDPASRESSSFDNAATGDVIVLAVPVQAIDTLLAELAPKLRPGQLLIDVASVKVEPIAKMLAAAPDGVDVLGTHPLFGPQTVAEVGLVGQPVVVCPARIGDERLATVRTFLESTLGLRTITVDPDEHDRQMAHVQVLTHLVGHTVREMGLTELPLATLAYTRLLQLMHNTEHDSDALFATIQRANPHAAEARDAFAAALDRVRKWAEGGSGPSSPNP